MLTADSASFLPVEQSRIDVLVKHQVAIVTSTQRFRNTTGLDTTFIYSFPTPENASVVDLRWTIGSILYVADLQGTPQDTSLVSGGGGGGSGGGNPTALSDFLGTNATWLKIEQLVPADSLIEISISYVELLPYSQNTVQFEYNNDYQPILTDQIDSQFFSFQVLSERMISSVSFLSHQGVPVVQDSFSISTDYVKTGVPANFSYQIEYSFSPDDLGIYTYSTKLLPGFNACDSLGDGFFALIIEPETSDSVPVVGKDFILILDQSGSMGGQKIIQAKEAANFIIDNLNLDDRFNIVRFSSSALAYADSLVPYSIQNQLDAKAYINSITSYGGTDFHAALTTGFPFLGESDSSRAQIVMFMTDGVGSPSGQALMNLVSSLRAQYAPNLNFFSIGIGDNVNHVDLTQVAQQNNGFAVFLSSGNLSQELSQFYLTIKNPVLLNPSIEFSPAIVEEMYPSSIPNLYQGEQLILTGRYVVSDSVWVTITGSINGVQDTITEHIFLTDSLISDNYFLYPFWAKLRIDELMGDYLAAGSTAQKDSIKTEIIQISTCYGVLSPFTSLTSIGGGGGPGAGGGSGGGISSSLEFMETEEQPQLVVYPNPASEQMWIEWPAERIVSSEVMVQIYDLQGKLIVEQPWDGRTPFMWDGTGASGMKVLPGAYIFRVSINETSYEAILIRR